MNQDAYMQTNKKVIFDIVLNIIAASLPIAMLQLLIYPNVAKNIGGESYGLMLTIYSVWIMISNSLGNVLNNIRLLKQNAYKEIGDQGDVSVLLRKWIAGNSLIVFIIIWIYCGSFSTIHTLIGTFIAACILLKAYLEVEFRINLNYVAILINNALLSIGFFLGYLVFRISNIWEFIFLFGYTFSCVYCIYRTNLLAEKPHKTIIYKSVKKDSYSLVVAAIINNLISYADKLVLYPLMGGTSVSIYYTATILGKITGMLTGPINSVMLSYISKWNESKSHYFVKLLVGGIGIAIVGYVITISISKPVLLLLFPQWVDEVMEIIPLTTATIMLGIVASLLQPFIMKYCKMQWQIWISGIGSVAYFLCAVILWRLLGLKGFCLGTIIGITVKIIIMVIVYHKSTKRKAL